MVQHYRHGGVTRILALPLLGPSLLVLLACLLLNQGAAAQAGAVQPVPYSPNDDPFVPLIEEIDKNIAPPTSPSNSVRILDTQAKKVYKTVTGGVETVAVQVPNGTPSTRQVRVEHVTFKSVPVFSKGQFHDDTVVYAMIARPADAKPSDRLPGILFLYGGGGCAQALYTYNPVLNWAAAGYVIIACDLPGIAGELPDVGSGTWRSVKYNDLPRFTAWPNIKASWVYTADATALKAFSLLRNQPDVDPSKLGIVGISWGGYATTMLCGLLGDRVAAGFSVFGSGFFDLDSAFQLPFLPQSRASFFNGNPEGLKNWESKGMAQWLAYLDAGRRAENIKCNFYLCAASDDHFFRPPAVTSTLKSIKHARSLGFQFSPNDNHTSTTPGGMASRPPKSIRSTCRMEEPFFDYYLKGVGAPLPSIALDDSASADANGNLSIRFSVKADPSLKVEAPALYYSTPDKPWTGRKWIKLDSPARETLASAGVRQYIISLPASIVSQKVDWYLLVSENNADRQTTVSTLIQSTAAN